MKISNALTLSALGVALWGAASPAIAQENAPEAIASDSLEQVSSVFDLRDVAPGDWAFDGLRSLVERYGCIQGYPNQSFQGNRAMTRYEFAAGLNACLDGLSRMGNSLDQGELAQIQRLIEEFAAELATLGDRVDNLEARTTFLEDHQFSTTTKLVGEVTFTLADTFGNGVAGETVLHDKVRIQLVSSFTGKDKLFTRLTGGNVGNSFADELGTQEGRYAYDGAQDNNLVVDRLHYYFPVGDKLTVYTMASLGGHWFYADTFNAGLESGGGGNGALSRFGERNPLYRYGLGGQGAGLRYQFGEKVELSLGYLADAGSNPAPGAGLFNGGYSGLGQLVIKPSDRLKFGITYLNSYDTSGTTFNLGGTGTTLANLGDPTLGLGNTPVLTNSYGLQGQFDVSDRLSFRGWAGFSDATLIQTGEGEIWTYGLAMTLADLGKEGNMGALIVGAEPYLGSLTTAANPTFTNDTPIHVEALYKHQLSDRISLTPGIIWLTAPNQNNANSDVVIGTLRTTFSF